MVSTPKPISFPRDNLAHDSIIEWWYFNGHLQDKAGNQYSYMDCLFKADLKKIKIPFLSKLPTTRNVRKDPYVYFAHSVISDINKKKNYKEIQNISLVSQDSFTKPMLFANYINPMIIGGYTNCEIEETAPFNFHIKTERMDLTLESRKKPLLESGQGHISVCGRESYYYSLTDLHASGRIKIEDEWIPVEGKSWMDHQWADVQWAHDKWSWFSLQLEDGVDIMCVEYDSGKEKECLVDVVLKNGEAQHFKKLLLTPGKNVWRSKETKAIYPMSWEIEIPEMGIKLEVESTMPDQEMVFGGINYWEGPLQVRGSVGEQKMSGVGFMELVGYPADYNYLMFVSKNLAKSLLDFVRRK